MKQKQKCGWCKKTDELIPMKQGGKIATVCPVCNSSGPNVEFEVLRKAYLEALAEIKLLKFELAKVKVTKLIKRYT